MNSAELELRHAILEDAKLVFDWANDPITRDNSLNPSKIDWNGHLAWFTEKIDSDGYVMLVFEMKGKPVGIVRFDSKTNIISISVDKAHRGKGIGKEMLGSACEEIERIYSCEILADVREDNKGSQAIFEQNDFVKVDEVNVVNHIFYKYRRARV